MPYKSAEEGRQHRREYYRKNTEKCLVFSRAYNKAHAEELAARRKIYFKGYKEKNLKQYLISAAKFRAKKRGIPFDLSPDDFNIPEKCPVLGHVFEPPKKNAWWSPSLDKIIPSLGYVKGNVRVISMRANMIKGDASLEELEKVVEYVRRVTQLT